MPSTILCIAAVALFWGGWPLVARVAGENGLSGSLVLAAVTFVSVAAAALLGGAPLPSARGGAVLALAGLMMGLGLVAFNAVSSDPRVELSTAIPVMDTSMLLVSVIGGIWFFSEPVTARKLLGIALLVSGILTLRPGA
jgi:drug/metabolite transporter (DMT)-like permease